MSDRQIIHSKKLWDGRETAMEIHRRLAWGNKPCDGCGAKDTAVRIQTFVALSDMSAETRMEVEFQISMGKLHPVLTSAGRSMRTGLAHACPRCKPAALRAAAKGPSFAAVDIDEGPGEDKPIVQVIGRV